MIKDQPIQQFLDELASKASTPGGGSAAAIMGAMGAALGSMVGNFTVGKKGYEDVDAEVREILDQCEALRDKLTGMIKADIDVFNQVMGAYGMPKDTDEQKAERSKAIQAALKEATDVPLDCAKAAAEVIKLSKPLAEKGNKNVISDAGVAVLAAEAALRSAALNVYINVGGIKDEDFKQSREQELEQTLSGTRELTDEVYEIVKSRL
ncbi:formiminotetrahydrofolate cyclodeaminase [Methylohalomonas lacus]|uniref:Formiminotetrahydrofolate cyclodeaminase n=1 Tax=Methylohalomonas lacus TaxID=398773 RepID=A0AAE3HM28_9GAMM|nr:methenyltetrahydrofolate cyclohydrolase [Methylohalomonas lacus]MCS3902972.1 formiminotetrahydrofolate cyclodeaminase [Methylohalomonas lacus]